MGRTKHGVITAVAALLLFGAVGSCGNKSGKLDMITVTPAGTMIARGTTSQFNATAFFSDGSLLNWNSAATWTSSDESAVTVSNQFGSYGLASSLAGGATRTVIITATDLVNNISGSAQLIVADLLSITVQGNNPVVMPAGTSRQFTATGIFGNLASSASGTIAADITSYPTTSWSSSDASVAGLSTSVKGLVIAGTKTGTAVITAQDIVTNVSGTTLVTVQ